MPEEEPETLDCDTCDGSGVVTDEKTNEEVTCPVCRGHGFIDFI